MSRLAKLKAKKREEENPLLKEADKDIAALKANVSNEKATPPMSRLDRLKAKADKVEQQKKDVTFLKRSMGQQARHAKDKPAPETEKPKEDEVLEEKTVVSRLERLGMVKTKDQATSAKLVKVQLSTDDSHLRDSDHVGDRREQLMAEVNARIEDSNAPDPFKMVPFEILDDSQKRAVSEVGKYKYAIIDGPAGTGKTTVTQHVVERTKSEVTRMKAKQLRRNYESEDEIAAIAFVAFTGKAVQNMREKLPLEFREHNCMTMHKLLGYAPEYEEYTDKFGNVKQKRIFLATYDHENPLLFEKIYIDEGGMAGARLVNEIIAAAPHAQIIFIGDNAQLPAIHGIAPFNAYLTTLPTFTLDKVHRTSDDDLVMHATNIRHGKRVEFNKINCWHKLISTRNEKAQVQAVSAIVNLHKSGQFDPVLDTIITPTNKNELGQLELNRLLRGHFNPDNKPVIINAITQTCRYAIGDKVMVLSNDDGSGLTNGMTGYIVDIERNGACTRVDPKDVKTPDEIDLTNVTPDHGEDEPGKRQASHITYVYFPTAYAEQKIITFSTQGQYSALSHGYVTTCHKAQGSEYRNVVVVMHPSGKRLINREWFYTAWTRAKEKVYVLSDINSLACARNKQYLKGTSVKDKAERFIEKHRAKLEANTKVFDATMGTGMSEAFNWECPVLLYEEEM